MAVIFFATLIRSSFGFGEAAERQCRILLVYDSRWRSPRR